VLADIGNTHIHIYDGREVIHLTHDIAISNYAKQNISYISVNSTIQDMISAQTDWIDISSKITLNGAYQSMGIDRKALCLSYSDAIFIDAGSAITVDIVESDVYRGGFILLGLRAYIKAYANISPALKIELDRGIDLDTLPMGTRESISYGILNSIQSVIDRHKHNKQLYITGGDGEFLSSFFEGAIFDERLIFLGMQRF